MTRARLAAVAAGCAAALMVVIQVVGAGLATDVAPFGLVSLQFVTDPADAVTIVASWSGDLRTAVLRAHGLDLLLPLAYGTATVTAGAALAAGRAAGTGLGRTARRAGLAGGAAAGLDQVENVAMAVALLAAPGVATTAVTVAAAVAKWTLLAASVVGLAVVRWRTRGLVATA